jgi:hypothetical protein
MQEQKDFYESVIISMDGAMTYCRRFSELAKEEVEVCKDEKRKKELLEISRMIINAVCILSSDQYRNIVISVRKAAAYVQ